MLIHSADISLFQKHLRLELESVKKIAGIASATGIAGTNVQV